MADQPTAPLPDTLTAAGTALHDPHGRVVGITVSAALAAGVARRWNAEPALRGACEQLLPVLLSMPPPTLGGWDWPQLAETVSSALSLPEDD